MMTAYVRRWWEQQRSSGFSLAVAFPYLLFAGAVAAFLVFAKSPFELPAPAAPGAPGQTFARATVQDILSSGEREVGSSHVAYQDVAVLVQDGPASGQTFTFQHGGDRPVVTHRKLSRGQQIVLTSFTAADGEVQHYVADVYRMDTLPWLLAGFAVLVTLAAGWKGVGSLAGLAVSFIVIMWLIIPRILSGDDPVMVSIGGALAILLTTTYLAHGISTQTTIALVATLLALILTALLSIMVVNVTQLTGLGNEDAHALQIGHATAAINLQGLFLSGVIISTLGALNDITVTQSVTIFELAQIENGASFGSLVRRGLFIGREHVASLVNTLVLAYAGTSLALFIILVVNPSQQPSGCC